MSDVAGTSALRGAREPRRRCPSGSEQDYKSMAVALRKLSIGAAWRRDSALVEKLNGIIDTGAKGTDG